MKALTTRIATVATLAAPGGMAPALSETTKPVVVLTVVDPTIPATGWRASDLPGASAHDDAGAEIGKLEDMDITVSGTVPYAAVPVGGFLRIDAHQVVVPAAALELMGKKRTLHGATKESLKALPNFAFTS